MRTIALGCSMFIFGFGLAFCGSLNAQTPTARQIFRCQTEGGLTFSDRPCEIGAEVHELDPNALNTFEPPPAAKPSSQRAAPAPKQAKRAAGSADPNKHKQKCERLTQGLKDIRAKQRTGYRASEAERLRARETKLKAQLREARCS